MSDTQGDLVRIEHPELRGPWGPVTRAAFEFRYKVDGWTLYQEPLPTDPTSGEPDLPETPKATTAPARKVAPSKPDKER